MSELTSEVNSRMRCVAKIMAMLGRRRIVAYLYMFASAACDGRGPGFVNASVRTVTNARQVGMRMHSKCTRTHRHARVDANNTSENMEQTGTWVHQVVRTTEEELREDKQALKTREQKEKAEDAKRIRGSVHEINGTSRMQDEMEKLMHHDEQELLSLWRGWLWKDNKGGWLDPELCAKARREEVEYIRRHKMYTRVRRLACLSETDKALIKTGWTETDKGQPGKLSVHGRWVGKKSQTHARPELYASTPPLEALKVVLSEVPTGKRGGKVLALVDVRRAYLYAPASSTKKSIRRTAARRLPGRW